MIWCIHSLTIFPAVTTYLQTSPGSGSHFFPYIGEVEQIHTHKVPSDKSLFLHKAPSVKSTPPSPPLFHHEDATENHPFSNYSGNIYLQLWVALFQLSVSRFSEMQFGVKYLETWGSTQPYFAFLILALCSHSLVFGGSHTVPNSLTLHEPVSVASWVKFFYLVHGWGLSSLSCSQYCTFFNSTFVKIRVGSVLLHLWHLQSCYLIHLLKLPHDVQNKSVWLFCHQTSYISEHKEWHTKVKYHPDKSMPYNYFSHHKSHYSAQGFNLGLHSEKLILQNICKIMFLYQGLRKYNVWPNNFWIIL